MKQQINLYNAALRQPREWVSARNLAVAAAACLLLVSAIGGAARLVQQRAAAEAARAAQSLKSMQDQLALVNAQIAARQPNSALQREVDTAQALLKSREEVLAALGNVSIEPGKGFAAYLRGLARQSLQGVWLTGIFIGPGTELSLRGRTINQSLVADYVKRLAGETVFNGHRFSQLTMSQGVEPKAGSGATVVASPPPSLEFNLQTSPASGTPAAAPGTNGAAVAVPLDIASLTGART